MKTLNTKEVCDTLNEIIEYELAGVVRYTHSSLMVTGPYRIPIVTFLKELPKESQVVEYDTAPFNNLVTLSI